MARSRTSFDNATFATTTKNLSQRSQCKHIQSLKDHGRVGSDIFEINENKYVILVDYYSSYFELTKLSSLQVTGYSVL